MTKNTVVCNRSDKCVNFNKHCDRCYALSDFTNTHPLYKEAVKNDNVDIHLLIDDAMEKKDRTVSIFITKNSTTINVYPNTDDGMKWIEHIRYVNKNKKIEFECSKCGAFVVHPDLYCSHCGEMRTGIIEDKEID